MRNLFSKKMYVERGNSEARWHPLPLTSLMLQLAWGKTKKAGQTIEARKHWMKKTVQFPFCPKIPDKPKQKSHNPENFRFNKPDYTYGPEEKISADGWR